MIPEHHPLTLPLRVRVATQPFTPNGAPPPS